MIVVSYESFEILKDILTCLALCFYFQIDYPDSRLMKPNSRHSYEAMDLEMMLALENGEVKVGGPIPDEKV